MNKRNFVILFEIDLGKDIFFKHVKLKNNGIIPINSKVNRPFWMDWVKFRSDNLEELFCYTQEDLPDLNK